MSDLLPPLGPRSFGDAITSRMAVNHDAYNAKFMEGYADALGRARRDGLIAPGNLTLSGTDPRLADEGRRVLGNAPIASAFRDELHDEGDALLRGVDPGPAALAYAVGAVIEGRVVVSKTVGVGDDVNVRFRGALNGRSDRFEARFSKPTDLGTLEVATGLRRGLDRPSYNASVGFRQSCNPRPDACGAVSLSTETRGDVANTRVFALTGHRLYRSGWMLIGGVEQVQDIQRASDTRVFVGAIYGSTL